MKQLSALTASLFLGLSLSFSGEATTWEKYPGIQGPGIAGMVIGDFDGNGTPEALVTGSAGNGATHFLAVLSQDSTGELGIRTITTVPRRIVAPVILAPQSDGSDFLAVITGDINNSTTNQILILGGIPLRVLRTIEAPLVQRISSIADVDGDGQLDIVVLTYLDSSSWQYYPAILDYQTGNVSWVSIHQAGDVGVAQLDDDPALELILATEPGRIIDGATLQDEWTYAGGFGDTLLVGRFGNDGRTGFATIRIFSDYVQIFRSQPYSPVAQIDVDEPRTASTVQLEKGSADHIAIGSRDGDVFVYDPRTGQRVLDFPNQYHEVNAIAVGDINGDGSAELIYGTGTYSFRHLLRAVSLDTLDDVYLQRGEFGPYSSLVRGEFQGGDSDQIALFAGEAGTGFDLDVLDSFDGSRLRRRANVFDASIGEQPGAITSAQLRTDGQQDIVVTGGRFNRGVVAVLDGLTLEDKWSVGGNGSVFENSVASNPSIVDANGDGTLDVAVVVASNSTVSVVALDGRDGTVLWQSVGMWGLNPARLASFRTNDGAARVVVSLDAGLYMFDFIGQTRVASSSTPAVVIGLWQWGEGPACRLGALNVAGVVTIHRCDTLAIEGQRQMPQGTVFFRPLDAQASRYIAASGAYLYEITPDDQAIRISEALGNQLGANNLGDVRPGSDAQHFDVVIGSDYMVTRVQVALDGIFTNAFD